MNLSGHTLDLRAALREAMGRLQEEVPSHTLAAELLLMHVLGCDRAWLYAHPEEPIDLATIERYFHLVERRATGVPTQHLTGRQEFWGLEFEVTPDVLIPRPETEHVVEVALDRWAASNALLSRGSLQIADVGTGSGCLGVALALELPQAEVFATDVSPGALAVARRNAARHNVSRRVHLIACNLLDAFLQAPSPTDHESGLFELIVSNPPYVGRREASSLPHEVREHEPSEALFGGQQGFEIYDRLIAQAAQLVASRGIVVLELGYNGLSAVRPLLERPAWREIGVTNDLAGIPRVIAAKRA